MRMGWHRGKSYAWLIKMKNGAWQAGFKRIDKFPWVTWDMKIFSGYGDALSFLKKECSWVTM